MLWSFAIGLVVFLLGGIIRRLEKNWRTLPKFVFNRVGNMEAFCSVSDFRRGAERHGYVVVPDTLVFTASPLPHQHGLVVAISVRFWLSQTTHEPRLFVPFVSERDISYEEQAAIFTKPPRNVDTWIAAKSCASAAEDKRMQFVRLVSKANFAITLVRAVAVGCVVVSVFGWVANFMARSSENQRNAPAVFYTTTPGSSEVTEHRGRQEDIWKLPMTSTQVFPAALKTGTIRDVMHVGGNLDYVCLVRMDGWRNCGFAAPGLKSGDTAYMRTELGKRWIDERGHDNSEAMRWVITEREAQALLDKGFHLER